MHNAKKNIMIFYIDKTVNGIYILTGLRRERYDRDRKNYKSDERGSRCNF